MKPRGLAVIALLVGPAAAMTDEIASYILLRHPIMTSAGALVAGGAAVASYRILRRKTEVLPVDRFLALAGLLLNVFFLFVIIFGFGIPKLVLHPTD